MDDPLEIPVRLSSTPRRGNTALVRGMGDPEKASSFTSPRKIERGPTTTSAESRRVIHHQNLPNWDGESFGTDAVALETTDMPTEQDLAIKCEEKKLYQSPIEFLISSARKFTASISHPFYFIVFNLICFLQAVPAITYYVLFFSLNWHLPNSTGMPPVWGATIGSIATAVVTCPLVPLPPDTITQSFCIAVVMWEFWVSLSLLIAGLCLGAQLDGHGCFWSLLGSLLTGYAAVLLRWLGIQKLEQLRVLEFKGIDIVSETETAGVLSMAAGRIESGPLEIPLQPFTDDTDVTVGDINVDVSQNSYDGLELGTSARAKLANATPARTMFGNVRFYVIQFLLWTVLFVFAVIPGGFAVDQAMTAWEKATYQAPGLLFGVPSCMGHRSTCIQLSMHLHCVGPDYTNRPTVVFEADNFTTGFIFWNLQDQLSEAGWRSCAYDRAGYGWSEMPPLGSTNPADTVRRLHQLLLSAGELHGSNKSILVGYGGGSDLVQIYAHTYPDSVAAVALIDGYSNLDRLLEHSTNIIHKNTLQQCGNLNIGRALESAALMRAVTDYFANLAIQDESGFVPSYEYARYMSTFTNGRYWDAQFNDLCMRAGAASANTDYLSDLASTMNVSYSGNGFTNSSSSSSSSFSLGNTKWPVLRSDVPVLIVSAGDSIRGSDLQSSLYREQARLYNETLSPNMKSKWITCDSCRHSLAYDDKSYWLAAQIDSYFGGYFPVAR